MVVARSARHHAEVPPMPQRLAIATIAAVLSLAACGVADPTATPAATGRPASPTPAPSPSAAPDASPSASPVASLRIDEAAYLAGDAFTLPVGEAGADWTAPSAAPLMPDGKRAVRVAFLPASCAIGSFTITAEAAAPEDAWETILRGPPVYPVMSWPAAQVPECADGHGWTYLQVGYHPFAPLGTIHLVASISNVNDAPAEVEVEVVPVFTSADATQPSLTSTGFIAMGPISGPEKPRSASKLREMASYDFVRATLPDGTAPTRWGLKLTGCGPVGGKPPGAILITARVGNAAPVEVGTCLDGGYTSGEVSLPLPADRTQVSVLTTGGTTRSQVRVSEFQWRGDRP
jgi:hypothetical protein